MNIFLFKISQEEDPIKLISQAQKALKKSFFHTPDHLEAQLLYNDAAKIYNSMRNNSKAAECYKLAAECALTTSQNLSAAVLYKEAMTCLLKMKEKDYKEIFDLADKSIYQFQLAGKFIESARLYLQLSSYAQDNDQKKKYLQEAVDLFIQENKPSQAASALFETFCQCIVNEQYDLLNIYSEKLTEIYKQLNYGYKIDQMRLSLIIVSLKLQDIVTAEQQLEYFENYTSDEYKMGEDLINGFKSQDINLFEQGKENYGGKLGLSNEVLKILKDLKIEKDTEFGDDKQQEIIEK